MMNLPTANKCNNEILEAARNINIQYALIEPFNDIHREYKIIVKHCLTSTSRFPLKDVKYSSIYKQLHELFAIYGLQILSCALDKKLKKFIFRFKPGIKTAWPTDIIISVV
jgi:hypothetical protein